MINMRYALPCPARFPVPNYRGPVACAAALVCCHFFSAYRHQSRGRLVLFPLCVDLVKETSAGRAASAGQGKAPRVSDRLPLERREGARQGRREVRFCIARESMGGSLIGGQLRLGVTYTIVIMFRNTMVGNSSLFVVIGVQ